MIDSTRQYILTLDISEMSKQRLRTYADKATLKRYLDKADGYITALRDNEMREEG